MLEERAKELFEEASSGKFVDADQDPTTVLDEIAKVCDTYGYLHPSSIL